MQCSRGLDTMQKVEQNMLDELQRLRSKVTIGLVGGSDLNKQVEQLGPTGELAAATCDILATEVSEGFACLLRGSLPPAR